MPSYFGLNQYKKLQQIKGCNTVSFFRNNSGVFNGKTSRKFLIALGSHYKNRSSPLRDVTTMKKFSELEFHGEYQEFSLLSIAPKCKRHQFSPWSVCSLTTRDWCLYQSESLVGFFPKKMGQYGWQIVKGAESISFGRQFENTIE